MSGKLVFVFALVFLDQLANGEVAIRNARTVSNTFIKPDDCQLRDDYAASNQGRSCQRKCANDNDCLNDRKLCLCDGVCGLSCIRPEKECPELPDPPHGQVHLTGR